MSETYFSFYKRRIEEKKVGKETITNQVNGAHMKGRLTDNELSILLDLIRWNYAGNEEEQKDEENS